MLLNILTEHFNFILPWTTNSELERANSPALCKTFNISIVTNKQHRFRKSGEAEMKSNMDNTYK